MNSLRSLGRAIDYEIERQVDRARRPASGSCRRRVTGTKPTAARTPCARRRGRPTTATSPSPTSCRWRPTDEMRAAVHASMPELPAARRGRLQTEWGISDTEARVLVGTEGLADYAEAAVTALDGGTAARRRQLGERRRARSPQRDRPVARGAAARARRAGRARRARRGGHDLAQPGQGRAGRVPAASRSGRSRSSRSAASRR